MRKDIIVREAHGECECLPLGKLNVNFSIIFLIL